MPKRPGTCFVCSGHGVVLLGALRENTATRRLRKVHAARVCQLCRGSGLLPKKPLLRVETVARRDEALRESKRWAYQRAHFRHWRYACVCLVGPEFGRQKPCSEADDRDV